jgi:8-oxo-dGTP pyrophosphatase MutT (NUDIX family)
VRARASDPTHAGGVVYRMRKGRPEFLLTTARRRPDEWVLPKGHIDPRESPEEATVREVAEETGVIAVIESSLGETTIVLNGLEQRVLFFLMRFIEQGPADEGRSIRWLPGRQAEEQLTFENLRPFIRLASGRLRAATTSRPNRT